MKIISHRGNISGPEPEKENSPQFIDEAIKLGLDVEIDLRIINDNFLLGHDYGQYEINIEWLLMRKNFLWIHCKNLEAATILSKYNDIKYFCHISDPYVVVNNNFIWVHDLTLNLNEKCIIPLITKKDIEIYNFSYNVYGICSDFVIDIKNKILTER